MSEASPEPAPEDTVAVHLQTEGGGEGVITVPHSPSAVVAPRQLPPLPPAPSVIILRGVSGSGKSSLAKHFQSLAFAVHYAPPTLPPSPYNLPPAPPYPTIICSADAFFIHRGVYRFDSKRLSEAHAHCLSHFLALLSSSTPHIVVDNTNVERWQYVNYARMAELMGYAVTVVEVRVNGDLQVAVCAERNQHGVALPGVQGQMDKWEEERAAVRVDAVWTEEEKVRMRRREEQRAQRAAERAQREAAWAPSRAQLINGGSGGPSPPPVQTAVGEQERSGEVQLRRGWSPQPLPQPSFAPPPARGFTRGMRGRGFGGYRGGVGAEAHHQQQLQERGGVGYQGVRRGHHQQMYPPYPRSHFPRPHPPRGPSTHPNHWVAVQSRQPGAGAEGSVALKSNGEPRPPPAST